MSGYISIEGAEGPVKREDGRESLSGPPIAADRIVVGSARRLPRSHGPPRGASITSKVTTTAPTDRTRHKSGAGPGRSAGIGPFRTAGEIPPPARRGLRGMVRDAGDLAGRFITDALREVGMDRIREAASSVMMLPELDSIIHWSRLHGTELCVRKNPGRTGDRFTVPSGLIMIELMSRNRASPAPREGDLPGKDREFS
jgi:hypothetical protein